MSTPSVDTSAMTADAASAPQPSSQFIIAAFQEEVDKVNANRMYLLAVLKQTQHEARMEVERLQGAIASIVSMVEDDDNRARITTYLEGSDGTARD